MKTSSVPVAVGVVVSLLIGFGAGTYYAKHVRQASPAPQGGQGVAVGEPNPSKPNDGQPSPNLPGQGLYPAFLIALEGNGKNGTLVGCGDSLVPDGEFAGASVKEALTELLGIKTQFVAETYGPNAFYNSLYQSKLAIQSISPSAVKLTGTLSLGGECDNPRAEAQLEATVRQFPGYEKAVIYLNGKTLKDAISLK